MKPFINNLSFTKKRIPIPPEYRPLYKIGHIVLILFMACRGNKVTLMKLHFLCWTLKAKANLSIVENWIKTDFKNEFHIWGIEPTVNRALRYAVADDLIHERGGEFFLTTRGVDLAKKMSKDKELFTLEKTFLARIGKNTITEQQVKNLSQKFL